MASRAARLRAVPELVDVQEMLEAVVTSITTSSAAVRVDVPPGLAVLADRRHVERVVRNLLTNAMKHGAPPVTIEAREERHAVVIEVSDAGAGVPEGVRDHLFQRFAAADVDAASSGTGLGLSIVAALTALNGGAAGYRDVEPHGACFWVRFPSAPTAPGTTPRAEATSLRPGRP